MPEACFKIGHDSGRWRFGFTLIEILLVIALIGAMTGLAIHQMDDVDLDEKPLDEWVWETIFHARLQALETREKAVLYFDEEARSFHIKTLETVVQSFKVPPNHTGEITVAFYPLLSDEGTGSFELDYAEDPIEELVFHPSGASVPVRINISNSLGEDLVLTPDPFASYFQELGND